MTFAYIDKNGAQQQVEVSAEELFAGSLKANLTPAAYINQKFADADLKIGPAFRQMQAGLGICSRCRQSFRSALCVYG